MGLLSLLSPGTSSVPRAPVTLLLPPGLRAPCDADPHEEVCSGFLGFLRHDTTPLPPRNPQTPKLTQYKHAYPPSGAQTRRFITLAAETDLSSYRACRDGAGYSYGPQLPFKKFVLGEGSKSPASVSVLLRSPPAARMSACHVPRML